MKVLRYVTIKHGAKDIAFEFPAADAASELISHRLDSPMEFVTFLLSRHACHVVISFKFIRSSFLLR